MICIYCKITRPENEAPCPNCGAPSSFQGQQSQVGGWGMAAPAAQSWAGPVTSANQQSWNDQGPQLSFEPAPTSYADGSPAWQQQAGEPQGYAPPEQAWGTYNPTQNQPQNGPPSLLPVPYQGDAQINYQQMQMQLIMAQNMGQMLPALPDQQGDSIYIPPIYTEPRPIIPRYRIISGVLSLLIVTLMLCGGSVYYAKASGRLIAVNQFFGNALPQNLMAPPAAQIPDPPNKVDLGPAHAIIPAASTASQVDPASHMPQQQNKVFQVGVPFYVTYSAYPPKTGNIVVKWYMNDQFYTQNASDKPLDPKTAATINGLVQMVYNKAASGKVELYWVPQGGTAQLAETLYFAVR